MPHGYFVVYQPSARQPVNRGTVRRCLRGRQLEIEWHLPCKPRGYFRRRARADFHRQITIQIVAVSGDRGFYILRSARALNKFWQKDQSQDKNGNRKSQCFPAEFQKLGRRSIGAQ